MPQRIRKTRNRPVLRSVCVLGAASLAAIASACWSRPKPDDASRADDEALVTARIASVHLNPASPIDFTARSQGPEFQSALGTLSNELGLRFLPMVELPGAYQATASYASVEENLIRWHQAALKHGAFLFRVDCNYDVGNQPDVLAVLPTADKYEVLQAVGTDGVNSDVDNAAVIAWLRTMEERNPFTLTGAALDFLEGYFVTPPQNSAALAKRMYDFCPDIVDQGTGSLEALAEELTKGKLYFWWD